MTGSVRDTEEVYFHTNEVDETEDADDDFDADEVEVEVEVD